MYRIDTMREIRYTAFTAKREHAMPLREDRPARRLIFMVRDVAENPIELHQSAKIPRQTAYNAWRGTNRLIHLGPYVELLRGLGTPENPLNPGDWFRWEAGEQATEKGGLWWHLVWQVPSLVAKAGIKPRTFGYMAQIEPRSLDSIWNGTSIKVGIDTLARIALALDPESATPQRRRSEKPVWNTGGLLHWEDTVV